jgi:cell shape-determining protein MreC
MIFAVVECIKLIQINTIKKLEWQWYVMLCLIGFFLIGYVVYYFLYTNSSNLPISSFLVSLILFFGAIFVIGVLTISYQLIKTLIQNTDIINQTNKSLSENSENLLKQTKQLEEAHILLKDKNSELKKTLEDFYTLRIEMQKNSESKTLEEENKGIKKKLEELTIKNT